MASASAYPVSVTGTLDGPISRWLFLVKWLLLIPHLLVLAVLLVGLVLSWLASLVGILATGRYPKSLFNYNVGVLRWGWRVGFYSYQALGTDKYPPFSLGQADYPADLVVEYPERLNRWLVLVKWLLILPHAIIVSIYQGGSGSQSSGGLISILVLISAIANLFTGRYPQDIFKLIMGMNRWSLRVFAYFLLMTDEYPPFRFEE